MVQKWMVPSEWYVTPIIRRRRCARIFDKNDFTQRFPKHERSFVSESLSCDFGKPFVLVANCHVYRSEFSASINQVDVAMLPRLATAKKLLSPSSEDIPRRCSNDRPVAE